MPRCSVSMPRNAAVFDPRSAASRSSGRSGSLPRSVPSADRARAGRWAGSRPRLVRTTPTMWVRHVSPASDPGAGEAKFGGRLVHRYENGLYGTLAAVRNDHRLAILNARERSILAEVIARRPMQRDEAGGHRQHRMAVDDVIGEIGQVAQSVKRFIESPRRTRSACACRSVWQPMRCGRHSRERLWAGRANSGAARTDRSAAAHGAPCRSD